MKPASIITILVGSMLLVAAAVGQTNTSAATHPPAVTSTLTAQRFNLDGIWQFTYNGKTIQVQFQQNGDQFKSFSGVGNLGRSDALLFEGKYASGVIVGQRITPTNTRVPEAFTVDDPDHVRTSRGVVLTRISPARADDAVCDLQNSSRTQSGYAYDRAIDAARHTRPLAVEQCWTQVSAAQGNPRAEDAMAMFYRDGEGVPKNPTTAFSWAQKSADQGDPVGQALLADFYKRGVGTSPNAQLAQEWQSKSDAQTTQQRQVADADLQAREKVQQMMQGAFWGAVVDGLYGSANQQSQADDYQQQRSEDLQRLRDQQVTDQRIEACHRDGNSVCW